MKCLWISSLGTSQKGESLERTSLTAPFGLVRYKFCILVASTTHFYLLGSGAPTWELEGCSGRIRVRVCAHLSSRGKKLGHSRGHRLQIVARLRGPRILRLSRKTGGGEMRAPTCSWSQDGTSNSPCRRPSSGVAGVGVAPGTIRGPRRSPGLSGCGRCSAPSFPGLLCTVADGLPGRFSRAHLPPRYVQPMLRTSTCTCILACSRDAKRLTRARRTCLQT